MEWRVLCIWRAVSVVGSKGSEGGSGFIGSESRGLCLCVLPWRAAGWAYVGAKEAATKPDRADQAYEILTVKYKKISRFSFWLGGRPWVGGAWPFGWG
jgi:hypothetical protein